MVENLFKQGGQGKSSFLPEEYVAAKSEARANILVLSLFAVVLAGVIGAELLQHTGTRRLACTAAA